MIENHSFVCGKHKETQRNTTQTPLGKGTIVPSDIILLLKGLSLGITASQRRGSRMLAVLWGVLVHVFFWFKSFFLLLY